MSRATPRDTGGSLRFFGDDLHLAHLEFDHTLFKVLLESKKINSTAYQHCE
jgi:hypothetical protein